MSVMVSQITGVSFTQPFVQVHIKENIKAPRHWPLTDEFTGDLWIPTQRASNVGDISIWWRHHEKIIKLVAYRMGHTVVT